MTLSPPLRRRRDLQSPSPSPSAGCRLLIACGLLLCTATAGCARADRVAEHETWPLEFADRALYRDAGILVYATGSAEAASAARTIARVESDFRALTGAEPRALVPVVIGTDEELPLAEDVAFSEWIAKHATIDETERRRFAADTPTFDEDFGEVPDTFLAALVPVPFPVRALVEPSGGAGPADGHAAWAELPAVFVPSAGARRDVLHTMVDRAMEKEEISFWKRLLLKPILPFVLDAMEEKLEQLSRVVLVQWQVRMHEPAWSDEEQKAFLERYVEENDLRIAPDFSEAEEEMERRGIAPDAPPPGEDPSKDAVE